MGEDFTKMAEEIEVLKQKLKTVEESDTLHCRAGEETARKFTKKAEVAVLQYTSLWLAVFLTGWLAGCLTDCPDSHRLPVGDCGTSGCS